MCFVMFVMMLVDDVVSTSGIRDRPACFFLEEGGGGEGVLGVSFFWRGDRGVLERDLRQKPSSHICVLQYGETNPIQIRRLVIFFEFGIRPGRGPRIMFGFVSRTGVRSGLYALFVSPTAVYVYLYLAKVLSRPRRRPHTCTARTEEA